MASEQHDALEDTQSIIPQRGTHPESLSIQISDTESEVAPALPWYQRHRKLLIGSAVVASGIALVAGITYAVTKSDESDCAPFPSSSPSPSPTVSPSFPISICNDFFQTVVQQVTPSKQYYYQLYDTGSFVTTVTGNKTTVRYEYFGGPITGEMNSALPYIDSACFSGYLRALPTPWIRNRLWNCTSLIVNSLTYGCVSIPQCP